MYSAALLTSATALVMALCVREVAVETPVTHAPSRTELIVDGYGYTASVHVWCDAAPLDLPHEPLAATPAGHSWGDAGTIVLRGCGPPLSSDPPTLSHALEARGVSPTKVYKLEMREVPPGARFEASHFAGLESLEEFTVQAAGDDRPQHLTDDLMLSLTNVSWLSLEKEALPPLSEQSDVYKVTLERGRSTGAWGGCGDLYILHLRDWIVPADAAGPAGGWLTHCYKLRFMRAEHMSLGSLRATLLGLGTKNSGLTSLELSENALTTPDLAAMLQHSAPGIVDLRVPHNNLTHIDSVLDAQTGLNFLDLSYNMLSDLNRTLHALKEKQYLSNLWLSHNPLRRHCVAPVLHHIKQLLLASTGVEQLCFSEWSGLFHLDLSNNHIEELQFGQLPLIHHEKSVTVNLRGNPLREVHFSESDYNTYNALKDERKTHLYQHAVMTVYTDALPPLHCDCLAWLDLAMQEGLVELPAGVRCHGGWSLQDAPSEALQCKKTRCGSCSCKQQWATRTVVMHCNSRGLQQLPELPKLPELFVDTDLHLMGNHIRSFRAEDLPKTLKLVDLRDNNITRMDAAAAAALFEVLERHVLLSGNPLACDCENRPLLRALQVHHLQVVDYENVTCSDGQVLHDVNEELLCSAWKGTWLITMGVGALLVLVALGVTVHALYKRPLKAWLHARGWCLCCWRKEESDTVQEYEAFARL